MFGVFVLVFGIWAWLGEWSAGWKLNLTPAILCLFIFISCAFFSSALNTLEKIRNSNRKMREMMEKMLAAQSTDSANSQPPQPSDVPDAPEND